MWVRLILAFALVCSAGSCLAQSLTFYTNRADLVERGEFARWVRECKKAHNIDVKVVALERYNQEMSARIARADYGDALLIPTNFPAPAWSAYFSPLNDFANRHELYFSQHWAYANQIYGLPLGVNVEGLIYNRGVFTALGIDPPTTLTELYAAAEKIKLSGRTAFALNIGAAWPLQQWDKAALALARNGDYFREVAREDQPFSIDKPYGKALDIARTFYRKGYSEKNITRDSWQQSKLDFASGRVAMLFMGSWVIPQLLDAGVKQDDIGFVPFPVDDKSETVSVLNVDWALAINKKSKVQRAAKTWLNFLLLESDYAEVSGYLPTIKQRQSGLPQLQNFMQAEVRLIQMQRHDEEFLRLANKAGLDFYQGNSIRTILINPDFNFTLRYWNDKWALARTDVPANKLRDEVVR